MSRLLLSLALLSLLSGCNTGGGGGLQGELNPAGYEQVTLSVENMHCEVMCARRVRDLLVREVGVQEAEVDFEKKEVTVTYKGDIFQLDHAVETLTENNFPSKVVRPNS